MSYALVSKSGNVIYFYIRGCAEIFQACMGGEIKEVTKE